MSNFDKDKFVFHEIFTNESGKQSGSGFVGVIMGLIATLAFIAGIIGWFLEINQVIEYLEKVIQLGFLSAALMGVRKVTGIWVKKNDNNIEYKG